LFLRFGVGWLIGPDAASFVRVMAEERREGWEETNGALPSFSYSHTKQVNPNYAM